MFISDNILKFVYKRLYLTNVKIVFKQKVSSCQTDESNGLKGPERPRIWKEKLAWMANTHIKKKSEGKYIKKYWVKLVEGKNCRIVQLTMRSVHIEEETSHDSRQELDTVPSFRYNTVTLSVYPWKWNFLL